MKIDKDQISRVSTLARLELTEEEREEFSRQLTDIVEYVEKINELKTDNIAPADHIVDLKNVFRKDTVKPSIEITEIEKMAPEFQDDHIVVPQVIEGSE
jgi:aspartyl-tRNA(Asn)/glutamyl-tRNA(Gln) amidotransferase subunit C